MIGLLVGRTDGDTEAQVLSHGGHGGDGRQGLVNWPLSTGPHGRSHVLGAGVDIVAAEDVRDEHAVELALFEHLCQVRPVR